MFDIPIYLAISTVLLVTAGFVVTKLLRGLRVRRLERLERLLAEANEARGHMKDQLVACGWVFTAYAMTHAAKGTQDGNDKAATNRSHADACYDAVVQWGPWP